VHRRAGRRERYLTMDTTRWSAVLTCGICNGGGMRRDGYRDRTRYAAFFWPSPRPTVYRKDVNAASRSERAVCGCCALVATRPTFCCCPRWCTGEGPTVRPEPTSVLQKASSFWVDGVNAGETVTT